jgi:hypothetical protein
MEVSFHAKKIETKEVHLFNFELIIDHLRRFS